MGNFDFVVAGESEASCFGGFLLFLLFVGVFQAAAVNGRLMYLTGERDGNFCRSSS